MEVLSVAQTILTVIGSATILLNIIAPLTKTKLDNKALRFLEKVLKVVSINKKDKRIVIKSK